MNIRFVTVTAVLLQILSTASASCDAGYTNASGTGCTACGAGSYYTNTTCNACAANTYSNVVVAMSPTTCLPCQANRSAATGSSECYCSPGFNGSLCHACSACTKKVVFSVTLDMTDTEFDAVKRAVYLMGVSSSLKLAPSSVNISGTRPNRSFQRRLLSTTLTVDTVALIPVRRESAVAGLVTPENIGTILARMGLVVLSVSPPTMSVPLPTTRHTPTTREFPTWFVISIAGAGLLVLLCCTCVCMRCAVNKSHHGSSYEDTGANAAPFATAMQVNGFMEKTTLIPKQAEGDTNGVRMQTMRPFGVHMTSNANLMKV
jgi:hypothetical protein